MIQTQIKLRLNTKDAAALDGWLWMLTGVWNWAVRKIELDAKDGIYYSQKEFHNLLANHGEKMGIPSHTLQGMLDTAWVAWKRCFKKIAKKPRLKGKHNRLASIPFPDPFRAPKDGRITIAGLGRIRFHKQEIPEGKIKCGRIVKRASGWYLCLFIDAQPKAVARTGHGEIGIDPNFENLLTTSDIHEVGEVIEHPRELEAGALRLAQAQRGHDKTLASRLQERMGNRRKNRNHKLSRRLVAENTLIAFSADNHSGIARKFGKSVSSSSHYQLRKMLSYKMPNSGGTYVEVDSKFSTMTCSDCGALTGPTGLGGLKVRQWTCTNCGSSHGRDVNSARNTLLAALGTSVERVA